MPNPDTPPSRWIEEASLSDKTFRWTGSSTNPKNSAGYGIRFNAGNEGDEITFSFEAQDFGGSSGVARGNTTSGSIKVVFIDD